MHNNSEEGISSLNKKKRRRAGESDSASRVARAPPREKVYKFWRQRSEFKKHFCFLNQEQSGSVVSRSVVLGWIVTCVISDFRCLDRMMRYMKLWMIVCLTTSLAAPSPQQLGLDIIDLAAISRMSPKQLEALAEGLAAEEIMRTKRSSAQAISSVVSKASSASSLGSKIGLLGQASSGALTFIASASSKSGQHDEHPGYSYEPQESKVDFWGLKKSILYTLLQAVKAITGGVTILKGQLIKGGGALASTLGKVISVKGEAVSNFGKKIVSSAALSHKKPSPPVYGPPPAHVDYPPSAYGAPTAPAHYSAPTAPAHYGAPSAPTGFASHKYPSHLDGILGDASIHQVIPVHFRRLDVPEQGAVLGGEELQHYYYHQ
ncbi:uncharacterized protein LOC134664282 isoform X2 [Cydia fagiglandana]|uniref:uncharacterized protein LOC134664282 isoform X2 n=1 Tax=Cydia fagiglandana TaxID=1458189 RepID=UPI002FEE2E33